MLREGHCPNNGLEFKGVRLALAERGACQRRLFSATQVVFRLVPITNLRVIALASGNPLRQACPQLPGRRYARRGIRLDQIARQKTLVQPIMGEFFHDILFDSLCRRNVDLAAG